MQLSYGPCLQSLLNCSVYQIELCVLLRVDSNEPVASSSNCGKLITLCALSADQRTSDPSRSAHITSLLFGWLPAVQEVRVRLKFRPMCANYTHKPVSSQMLLHVQDLAPDDSIVLGWSRPETSSSFVVGSCLLLQCTWSMLLPQQSHSLQADNCWQSDWRYQGDTGDARLLRQERVHFAPCIACISSLLTKMLATAHLGALLLVTGHTC